MKIQLLSAIAAVALGAGTALAQGTSGPGTPEPDYKCVPLGGAGGAQGIPNVGTDCATPRRYMIERENRDVEQFYARQQPQATASGPATRPGG